MRGYSKAHVRRPKAEREHKINITPIIMIVLLILLLIYIVITEGYLKK